MLTCIACSKQQLHDAGDAETARGTPSSKPAVKSLTSQIKDVVLKLSGAYKQCKATGPSTPAPYRSKAHLYRSYYDEILEVDGSINRGTNKIAIDLGYQPNHDPSTISKGRSCSSTPAWNYTLPLEPGSLGQFETWVPGAGLGMPNGGSSEPPVMLEEDDEPKEWVAQVEPGVHITFVALPQGGNDLKRIRFSRDFFNKLQAQKWWGENYDRIMELYNVQRFNRQALPTPPRSEDERDVTYSRMGSRRESPAAPAASTYNHNTKLPTLSCNNVPPPPRGQYPTPDPTEHFFPHHHIHNGAAGFVGVPLQAKGEGSSFDASRTTTSSRDEASVSVSNASDMMTEVNEWVEEDEPGVYVTIRQMADGSRDLRRIRFSRERFGEVNAKQWWEENRERIHAQYL